MYSNVHIELPGFGIMVDMMIINITGLQNVVIGISNYWRISMASSCRRKIEMVSIVVDTDRSKTILVPIESPDYELSIDTKIIFVRELSAVLLQHLFFRPKYYVFRVRQ